mmetsp:Transcript_8531/g.29162  ORF Transcript_8531/g.29162 Transcript_8531/m.29162 type:complete len:846 (+) Transcript_8531:124-2661(+)
MGVPAFFQWLRERYPTMMHEVMEGESLDRAYANAAAEGRQPVQRCDHLYLDLNGIVHPCCHPEDGQPQPKSEEEMLRRIEAHLDRLMELMRPTAFVYFALDGVAPRAKMNQQRTRRYVAAQERAEAAAAEDALRDELAATGQPAPEKKAAKWDHNVITPGTEFMRKLADFLRAYCARRARSHPRWKHISFLLSDATVPGEGEHKIMDWIRRSQADPDRRGERHAVCGQDADLMFLSLALHAPRVYVLRERVETRRKPRGGGKGGPPPEPRKAFGPPRLQYLSCQRLRRCLIGDASLNAAADGALPFPRDDERFLDDFVLLCFFVGNDFLPQLPSLSIPDGGLDLLLLLYRRALPRHLGGYLTDEATRSPSPAGKVDVKRVAVLLSVLGELEPEILRRRAKRDTGKPDTGKPDAKTDALVGLAASAAADYANSFAALSLDDEASRRDPTAAEAAETKALVERALAAHAATIEKAFAAGGKPLDLGAKGYRERYYKKVLAHGPPASGNLETDVTAMVAEYWRGVRFVAEYYHRGCASWSWYYPWHYAPLAADMAKCVLKSPEGLKLAYSKLVRDRPIQPLQQLMAVLPPQSAHCCPKAAAELMTSEKSELASQYPKSFPLDPNGKPAGLRWLWVALLPFCDIDRLVRVFGKRVAPALTEGERKRNRNGPAELVTARRLEDLAEDAWHDLPRDSPIPGSVKTSAGGGASLACSRVAYSPPELPPNAPPRRAGHDAPEDALADVRDYANASARAPRLPAGPESIDRALRAMAGLDKPRGPPRVPCRYFAKGTCDKGENCTFVHALPKPPPPAKCHKAPKILTKPKKPLEAGAKVFVPVKLKTKPPKAAS